LLVGDRVGLTDGFCVGFTVGLFDGFFVDDDVQDTVVVTALQLLRN